MIAAESIQFYALDAERSANLGALENQTIYLVSEKVTLENGQTQINPVSAVVVETQTEIGPWITTHDVQEESGNVGAVFGEGFASIHGDDGSALRKQIAAHINGAVR